MKDLISLEKKIQSPFKKLIREAKRAGYEDFADSCLKHLNKFGRLSPRQVEALEDLISGENQDLFDEVWSDEFWKY